MVAFVSRRCFGSALLSLCLMNSTNPFSLALKIARLEVRILENQEKLYDILMQDDFWPRVAESYVKNPFLDQAIEEEASDSMKQSVNHLANEIIGLRHEVHILKHSSPLES